MAIGNHALLSLDTNGQTTDGSLLGESGIRAAVYKNWVYLYDEVAHREEIPYTGETVGEVEEGTMQYGDIEIYAEQGPQNGVYAVFQTGYRHMDDSSFEAVASVAPYGHLPDSEFGITEEAARHLPTVVENASGVSWSDFVPYEDDHEYYYSNGNPKLDSGKFRGFHLAQAPRDWE